MKTKDLGNKKIMSENLKRLLSSKGLNVKEFSEIMDFKYTTVLDWFNAKTYPRIDKIELMSRYFGVDKSELVEEYSSSSLLLSNIVNISKQLEEPRQKIVLNTATVQLSEQNKPKVIDITKVPGYIPYDSENMGMAPILGDIAAGYNIMAEENFDGMMPVSAEYAGRDDVFWLNIKGKSMETLIHDGMFGLFEHSSDISDGKIGAVMAEDGSWVTVKRVFHDVDQNGYLKNLILVPEDESFDKIIVNEYNPARVIGRLLEVKQFF